MSESTSSNPVLVEIVRGSLVESRHTGAIAVADAGGRLVLALGDVECPIYPRSAVKAMQALPLVESGAADAFALSEAELAVACASHSGDRVHLDAVRSLLAKAGLDESTLACGAHWPVSEEATRELMRARQRPRAIHNNCSGKHAAMLATAKHLGLDPRGYEQPDHPVQLDDRANHFRDLRSRARSDAHGHRRLLGADLRAAARVLGNWIRAAR